ncbi:MAG: DUF3644 domain-containing protein, partial [Candidatus Zixiibacteriota bacterium]
IKDFDSKLTRAEFENEQYAYRILFIPKTANRIGQADRVIEFVKSGSPLAYKVNVEYAVIKETERPKYLPGQIVEFMAKEGYHKFGMHQHTMLWKDLDAKNPARGLGTSVADGHWYWYEQWLEIVRDHCKQNSSLYK